MEALLTARLLSGVMCDEAYEEALEESNRARRTTDSRLVKALRTMRTKRDTDREVLLTTVATLLASPDLGALRLLDLLCAHDDKRECPLATVDCANAAFFAYVEKRADAHATCVTAKCDATLEDSKVDLSLKRAAARTLLACGAGKSSSAVPDEPVAFGEAGGRVLIEEINEVVEEENERVARIKSVLRRTRAWPCATPRRTRFRDVLVDAYASLDRSPDEHERFARLYLRTPFKTNQQAVDAARSLTDAFEIAWIAAHNDVSDGSTELALALRAAYLNATTVPVARVALEGLVHVIAQENRNGVLIELHEEAPSRRSVLVDFVAAEMVRGDEFAYFADDVVALVLDQIVDANSNALWLVDVAVRCFEKGLVESDAFVRTLLRFDSSSCYPSRRLLLLSRYATKNDPKAALYALYVDLADDRGVCYFHLLAEGQLSLAAEIAAFMQCRSTLERRLEEDSVFVTMLCVEFARLPAVVQVAKALELDDDLLQDVAMRPKVEDSSPDADSQRRFNSLLFLVSAKGNRPLQAVEGFDSFLREARNDAVVGALARALLS